MYSDTQYCPSHDPRHRERLREAGRKGGEATARKFKRKGLNEEELPPLDSPEAAELWLENIARAVATGRLGHNEGRSATGAVREWLRAHEVGRMAASQAEASQTWTDIVASLSDEL